ncbi:FAD-binding protein [Actinomadura sp. LCR2-06]|uniref:FAD-binding protein n=1 Tax=Actinomadura violacea TaxID=2819934 RepID=A0ABS3S3C4_9ACTN|nr:FAD-binding protein [Actinomadura violacea]
MPPASGGRPRRPDAPWPRCPVAAGSPCPTVSPGSPTTQGGLVIDPSGRVLNQTGDPIPGLYAGGSTACGLASPHSDAFFEGGCAGRRFNRGSRVGAVRPRVRRRGPSARPDGDEGARC